MRVPKKLVMEGGKDSDKKILTFLLNSLPKKLEEFKKLFYSGENSGPLPEAIRMRVDPLLNPSIVNPEDVTPVVSVYIFIESLLKKDDHTHKLYSLTFDDESRELLLKVFSSKNPEEFLVNMIIFLEYLLNSDLRLLGYGQKKMVIQHVSACISGFNFLGKKILLSNEAAFRGDQIALKNFSSSRTERVIHESSVFGNYNIQQLDSEFKQLHPTFITQITKLPEARAMILHSIGFDFLSKSGIKTKELV
ncbi:MAG: hypothetical protein PHU63_04295 [Candidatus ainarchaeum sp.]|nr:hypothetical protein [Candidatus ainarchaeum sp.]